MGGSEMYQQNPSPESQEWIIIPNAGARMPCQRPKDSFKWKKLADPVAFEIQNIEEFKRTVDQLKEALLQKSYRAIALLLVLWFLWLFDTLVMPIIANTFAAFLVINAIFFCGNVSFFCYASIITKKHDKELAQFLTEWSQKLPKGYLWIHQVRYVGTGAARRQFSRLVFQVPLKRGTSTNVETPLEMTFDMEHDTNRGLRDHSTGRGRTEIEMTRSNDHFGAGEDHPLNNSDADMQYSAARRGEQI